MAVKKSQEDDKKMAKIQKTCTRLEYDKKRLTAEKVEAIQEKEDAKSYMSNLVREFNWLKRQTDDEQAGIMKLERDRNMLKNSLLKMEKNNEENK